MMNLGIFVAGLVLLAVGLWIHSPSLSLSVVGTVMMVGVIAESSLKLFTKRKV